MRNPDGTKTWLIGVADEVESLLRTLNAEQQSRWLEVFKVMPTKGIGPVDGSEPPRALLPCFWPWLPMTPWDVLQLFDQVLTEGIGPHRLLVLPSAAAAAPKKVWKAIGERLGYSFRHDGNWFSAEYSGVAPKWRVRPGSAAQSDAIRSLFLLVFGHEMPSAVWSWKYSPGRGDSVVVESSEGVIAHCGALFRDVLVKGRAERIAQLVDVMVHPRHRGVLTRHGPFFLVTATCIEALAPISFGFPNRRHMLLGEKIGFYREVERIIEVRWEPRKSRVELLYRLVDVDINSPRHRRQIDSLWNAMAESFSDHVIGVRDASWLEYRYAQHPQICYQIIALSHRITGTWIGVFVVKLVEDRMELLDMLASRERMPFIVEYARWLCGLKNCKDLYTWAAESSAGLLGDRASNIVDPQVSVPTIVWVDEERAQALSGWWLTPGDSDFH